MLRLGLTREDHRSTTQHRGPVKDCDGFGPGYLPSVGAARDLQDRLCDVTHSMKAALAQAATEGVQRELSLKFDAPILYERMGLPAPAKSSCLEPVQRRRTESIVEFGGCHLIGPEASRAPQ